MVIKFQDIELNIVQDKQHEFLLSGKEVAIGYGVDETTIRKHKQDHSDELIEGKHFITVSNPHANPRAGIPHTYTSWTKRGIIRLGFFIKSVRARMFRDWAEDLIIEITESPSSRQNSLLVDTSCPHWREAYYKAFDGRCFYTGKSLNPSAFHLDHICPASRGGADTIDNLVLCDPSFNMSKGAMVDMARIAKDQETVRAKYSHLVVMYYHSLKNNLVSPLVNPTQLLNKSTMEGLERYFGKAAMRDFYAKLIPGLRTDLIEANVAYEKDTIDEFISQCLTRSNDKIATRTVYDAYLEWARLNNSEPIPIKELSYKISRAMGIANKAVNINGKTTRAFVGVSVVSLGGEI